MWFLKCFDLPPNMLFAASAKHTQGKLADAEQWQSPPRSWLTSTNGITCLPTPLTLCTELMQVPALTPSDHYKIKVVKYINYFTYNISKIYYIIMLNVYIILVDEKIQIICNAVGEMHIMYAKFQRVQFDVC